MRTDKELLELLLENIEQGIKSGWSGMCGVIIMLTMQSVMSVNESERLNSIILANPTKMYKKSSWFFEPYQIEPRKEYLKQLIAKYEK